MELRRILVVDDEPQLAGLITRYLERLGFEVHAAASPEAAWDMLADAPREYALAVIDMTMPGLGGEELTRRALSADPDLRVLLASGYAADVSAILQDFPARLDFLQKPFTADMLADTVRRLLHEPVT